MRRRAPALLTALLVGTILAVLAPTSPAGATEVCTGDGQAVTGAPLYYPVTATTTFPTTVTVRPPTYTWWQFNATPGLNTCAPNLAKFMAASGMVLGWCGHSSGTGVTVNGYRFAWITAGGVMVITGELTGLAVVQPNVFNGQSCFPGATNFTVEYAVLKGTCNITKNKGLQTFPFPSTSGWIGSTVTYQTGPMHYWWKVCTGTP